MKITDKHVAAAFTVMFWVYVFLIQFGVIR